MAQTIAPYGSWKSPITPKMASAGFVQLAELRTDDDLASGSDVVYWSEIRPSEKGRQVICSVDLSASLPVGDGTPPPRKYDWTPVGFGARTRTHEYGGGGFFVGSGTVYFSRTEDQRLYRQMAPDAVPEAITPVGEFTYADGRYCAKTKMIYIVRENHALVKSGEAKECENNIVAINTDTLDVHVVTSGCDFYSTPRVSNDGTLLAWICWNHPNMPWDCTQLMIASLEEGGARVKSMETVNIGGAGASVAYCGWTPDNRLVYVSDHSGYWNLYATAETFTPASIAGVRRHVALNPVAKDVAAPAWQFGWTPWAYNPASGELALFMEDTALFFDMAALGAKTASGDPVAPTRRVRLPAHMKFADRVAFTPHGTLVDVFTSPVRPPVVAKLEVDTTASGETDSHLRVLHEPSKLAVDEGYLSVPEAIEFPTELGEGETPEVADPPVAYGLLYRPRNREFAAPVGERPPLLVRAHGGPTAQADPQLRLGYQYWTSRGYAVLDVDYRGSTGYGRRYRNALRGKWGVYDIIDCKCGALYLADKGLIDRKRIAIDGGSAGGFTTLACLAFTDVFAVGASRYGVADLGLLVGDTHKFESRYVDGLIGPYPADKATYDARSPINNIDGFNCPIILFQGGQDKVVPPNQAELMFESVKAKGIACAYLLFAEEGHGFRDSVNINRMLECQYYFFSRVFNFNPADSMPELEIENM